PAAGSVAAEPLSGVGNLLQATAVQWQAHNQQSQGVPQGGPSHPSKSACRTAALPWSSNGFLSRCCVLAVAPTRQALAIRPAHHPRRVSTHQSTPGAGATADAWQGKIVRQTRFALCSCVPPIETDAQTQVGRPAGERRGADDGSDNPG